MNVVHTDTWCSMRWHNDTDIKRIILQTSFLIHCLSCFFGYNLLPYANFLKLTKTYQFMWVYNSDINQRYIWEFRPVKVILNIVWQWKWATYINIFIWRKITMRDSFQNVSLHKESIQNHTRLKQYILVQFRNVHEEFHKYIIFWCLYKWIGNRKGHISW